LDGGDLVTADNFTAVLLDSRVALLPEDKNTNTDIY